MSEVERLTETNTDQTPTRRTKWTVSGPLRFGRKDELVKGLTPFLEDETGVMFGKPYIRKNRRTVALSLVPGKKYKYAGKTRQHHDAPEVVKELAREVQAFLLKEGIEQEFNTAIFTEYQPSSSPSGDNGSLNWHTDAGATANLQPGSIVASYVLGEARPISIRSNDDHKDKETITPGDGDVYAMLKGVQETTQHCVPKGNTWRSSLTLRTVKE
jgi:hypothetical protein